MPRGDDVLRKSHLDQTVENLRIMVSLSCLVWGDPLTPDGVFLFPLDDLDLCPGHAIKVLEQGVNGLIG
jgi:uncharacterized spore protein YtfJ